MIVMSTACIVEHAEPNFRDCFYFSIPFTKPDKRCLRWRSERHSLPVCVSCCRRSATHASSYKPTSQVRCPWFEQRGFKFTVKKQLSFPQIARSRPLGCHGSDAFAESKQRVTQLERSLQVICFCFGHIGLKRCFGLQAALNRTLNLFYHSTEER